MPEPDQNPRKVPLGDGMTADELDRLTHFSQGDLEQARIRFRKDAPAAFRSLLDADRINED